MNRMTLNDLRVALEPFPKDRYVRYDRFGLYAFKLDSWRGSYSEPALGWTKKASSSSTVGAIEKEIDLALRGWVYCGWKGGSYTFSGEQELWVDNPGECTFTVVVGVREEYGDCVLLTANAKPNIEK